MVDFGRVMRIIREVKSGLHKGNCAPKPVGCGAENVTDASFKDELSRKKYTISGLCQGCQDRNFE